MSDKRRVPGLQPICLGQQHQRGNNGQRNKRAIPPLKPLAKDDAKIELKIDMVTWRREMEKQKLTRIKKVKINKQASATTTAETSAEQKMEICSTNTDDSNSIKRAWNDVRELNSNEYKTLEAESMDILRDLI